MTSDAKVGLLLGLVFIVIIAFLINGIPNLIGDKPAEGIITNSVAGPSSNWCPRDKAEEVVKTVGGMRQTQQAAPTMSVKTPEMNTTANAGYAIIRSTETARQQPVAAAPTMIRPAPQIQPVNQVQSPVAQQMPVQINVQEILNRPTPRVSHKVPPLTKPKRQMYKVVSNDNLSKIAVKFYGPKEGNRYVNVTKIYEANKRVMSSMDSIREGQSLIIPPLNGKVAKPAVSFVQKIKNTVSKPKYSKVYAVKDGDTLSRIAAKQLGSAKRYSEIVKLNKSLQKNEDLIYVGMKLNLPK